MGSVPEPGARPVAVALVSFVAIYSLNHKSIGKRTQERPYTAAQHVRYITRPSAMSRLDGERLPVAPGGAGDFFRQAEDTGRANGRVADKLMLALPRELTPAQRAELVRGYAEDITGGKAPWLAAFHDKGKDAQNPHCHLILRDRDPATGRRVFGTSEKGSTERLRRLWERHANQALERAGRSERIDHRTLEAQGREGPPGIHEGPKPRAMERQGRRPVSRSRTVRNRPGAKVPNRRVDYPALDRGRSRRAYNAERRADREREAWQAIDADNRRRELETLRAIHHPPDRMPETEAPMTRAPTPLQPGQNPERERPQAAPAPAAKAPKPPLSQAAKPEAGQGVPKVPGLNIVPKPALGPAAPAAQALKQAQKPGLALQTPKPPGLKPAPKPELGRTAGPSPLSLDRDRDREPER